MGRPSKYNWEKIKEEFELGIYSQSELCLKFSISKASMSENVKKWNNGKSNLSKKGSMIYIIQMENTDIFKIGVADDPISRIRGIQVGNPYRLKLIDSFYKENAYEVERKIHKRYKKHRMVGEWFELSSESIEKLRKNRK